MISFTDNSSDTLNRIKLVTSEDGGEWRGEEIELPSGWYPEVVLVNGVSQALHECWDGFGIEGQD